jgi:hypothetical protein
MVSETPAAGSPAAVRIVPVMQPVSGVGEQAGCAGSARVGPPDTRSAVAAMTVARTPVIGRRRCRSRCRAVCGGVAVSYTGEPFVRTCQSRVPIRLDSQTGRRVILCKVVGDNRDVMCRASFVCVSPTPSIGFLSRSHRDLIASPAPERDRRISDIRVADGGRGPARSRRYACVRRRYVRHGRRTCPNW